MNSLKKILTINQFKSSIIYDVCEFIEILTGVYCGILTY